MTLLLMMMKTKSEKLDIHGILLVDKPAGLTSNAVLQTAKRLYQAKKAGHTGSLDPMATGMLPICFGEATKFSQYLLDADKCYETTGLLGVKTNTADAMGEVIARCEDFALSDADLRRVLTQFVGTISQVPSMYSALKHQGKPLYKYARAGIDIERSARQIMIHELLLNDFNGQAFSLTVTCSKGTYIRNLVEDIGEALGVGAHVTRLHRTYTLGFQKAPMFSLDTIESMSMEERMACLHPVDAAVTHLPRIDINLSEAQQLRQGRTIQTNSPLDPTVRLYQEGTEFIGLGEIDETGQLKVKRLISEAALMNRSIIQA